MTISLPRLVPILLFMILGILLSNCSQFIGVHLSYDQDIEIVSTVSLVITMVLNFWDCVQVFGKWKMIVYLYVWKVKNILLLRFSACIFNMDYNPIKLNLWDKFLWDPCLTRSGNHSNSGIAIFGRAFASIYCFLCVDYVYELRRVAHIMALGRQLNR